MAEFEDLEPIDYFGDRAAQVLIAIGWLGIGSDYRRGEVSLVFFERLKSLVLNRFEPMIVMGMHQCELCQYDGPSGTGNIFIPDHRRIFVCPELIVHYIAAHRYRPPPEFEDAVMRCPLSKTREYRKEFLRAGGKALLHTSADQRPP